MKALAARVFTLNLLLMIALPAGGILSADFGAALPSQVAQVACGFDDDFDQAQLNGAWSWVDPLGDSSYSLTERPGYLRLSTPDGGHDIYQNFDAPRILQQVDTDFIITTRVTIHPQYNYQGAGLMIWLDTENYIRLERTFVQGINMGGRVFGGRTFAIEIPFTVDSVYLRLQRSAGRVDGWYSTDGSSWSHAGYSEFPAGGTLSVGLALINEWQDNPISADFDFFHFDSCAPTADLSITMSANLEEYMGRPLIEYLITVRNNGPDDATGVTVTDVLPSEIDILIVADPEPGMCDWITTLVCDLGTMPPGNYNNIIIAAFALTAGPIANTATVSAATQDPNLVNNTSTVTVTVETSLHDADGDALPDQWETEDTDLDGDGVVDIGPSFGADVNTPDIFVEVDWMEGSGHSHRPSLSALQLVSDAFARAPAGPIIVHFVLDDALPEVDPLVVTSGDGAFPFAEYVTDHFDHSSQVFRYALFAHTYMIDGSASTSSGLALGQVMIVSLGGFRDQDGRPIGTVLEQAGTLMHELGHTLGLTHAGGPEGRDDAFNFQPNYLSVMNYSFQMDGLVVSDPLFLLDYSRTELPPLWEAELIEEAGLNNGLPIDPQHPDVLYGTKFNLTIPRWCRLFGSATEDPDIPFLGVVANAQDAVDWDCDGTIDPGLSQADLNARGGAAQVLRGHDDWSSLDFRAGNIGMGAPAPTLITAEDLLAAPTELTADEALLIQQIHTPRVVLSVSASPATVLPQGVVEYSIGLSNTDLADAHSVVIRQTLPPGFQYLPGSTSGLATQDPQVDGPDLSWGPFDILSGSSQDLSFETLAAGVPGTYGGDVSGTSLDGVVRLEGPSPVVVVQAPQCAGHVATIYVTEDGNVVGGLLNGRPYRHMLLGTDEDEVIVGAEGADYITGYGGDDLVCGLGGNDVLSGMDGNDTLYGDAGNDILIGWIGADLIYGGQGYDVLHGSSGNDILAAGEQADFLDGGLGQDECDGGGGVDHSARCEVRTAIP
jgi:uncharacterized repeat protein (TIGR01451 family)